MATPGCVCGMVGDEGGLGRAIFVFLLLLEIATALHLP